MKIEPKISALQQEKKPIVLFPKGETNLASVLSFDFGEISQKKTYVIGRYPLKAIEKDRFNEFCTNITPFLKRNLGIIPGIRSAFVKTKDTIEFAVAIDYDKSHTLFKSAEDMRWHNESVLSMDLIKMLMRAHIQRTGVVL